MQPFKVGVTVIVPVIFEPVPFGGGVHGFILPIPLAASPMPVFVLSHANAAPVGTLPKFGRDMEVPGQAATFVI